MCVLKTFERGGELGSRGFESDGSTVGFVAYKINSRCVPQSPVWCEQPSPDSLAIVAERYMAACDASKDTAPELELPFYAVRESSSDIVTGTESGMWEYLSAERGGAREDYSLAPITFGEILRGLYLGSVYLMDVQANATFEPLARSQGYSILPTEASESARQPSRFVSLSLKST